MNDFDFEELDKAVNNLASKTRDEHGGPDPAQAPKPAPMTITPAPVAEPKPEPKTEPVVTRSTPPAPTETPAIKSTSAPAKHRLGDTKTRRGSFMDIVPPAPRKSPTRVGVSVQPVSKAEDIVPEAPAKVEPESVKAPEPKPEVESKTPELSAEPRLERAAPQPTEPQSPPASAESDKKPADDVAWPDPLDFNDNKSDSKPAAPDAEPVSPFLAEAKVEKRPLGAFSNFKPAEESKQPDLAEPPKPEMPEVKDELTPAADGTFTEPEKAPLPPKEGEKSEEREPAKPDVHSAAMMAIPDQYRPEPKSTDKTPRPVYDTKEYHPPLIEATGHEHRGGGSMWGKIFIAFVVLALIAVGGYFAYIYFVQS